MESVESHLKKLREERIAREKARIEKLRELNLKKYTTTVGVNKPKLELCKPKTAVANNAHLNGAPKRPVSVSLPNVKKSLPNKPLLKNKIPVSSTKPRDVKSTSTVENNVKIDKIKPKSDTKLPIKKPEVTKTKPDIKANDIKKPINKIDVKARKSFAPKTEIKPAMPRMSMQTNRESVFERLYKPKVVVKNVMSDAEKLCRDPNFLKKVIHNSGLITNERRSMFVKKTDFPVRRSISAVHFKRISKDELSNCIHKWSSIGEKLDKVHLEVNEDEALKADKVISAVKSERKKVKFQTPVPFNFNTPKPEELQAKLKSWLQKRGKSIDSFHHLQCFGLHHMSTKIKPLNLEDNFEDAEENKENIALENDSDNESFVENMNYQDELKGSTGWRRASNVRESMDMNDTVSSTVTLTSEEKMHPVEELVLGALNDLTELLREGFDWEQCARWLRAIRDRYPNAPQHAAYWECRAALEETRGDLPASVLCWEEAIAKGTEHSVVEANLDHLLDKFMQLKISPNSGKKKQVDPKLVDVKNVFKSTIIRFAVQQARLRQTNQTEPTFTVTPVRRSARLSTHCSAKRTPLRVCATVKQASEYGKPLVFVPNDTLCGTP